MTKRNSASLKDKMQEKQHNPVEFIAFSGGGAKGAEYSGVVNALAGAEILRGVKAVAGSSAGAITAAFVATGIEAQEFERISRETNLTELTGKGFLINKDGKPLYELLSETIVANVNNFLGDADIGKICEQRMIETITEAAEIVESLEVLRRQESIFIQQIKQIKDEMGTLTDLTELAHKEREITLLESKGGVIIENIQALEFRETELAAYNNILSAIVDTQAENIQELKTRCAEGGKVYFKDLDLLRALDPDRFKDLLVTSVRRDTGELTIFSAKETPDVEIALACRASASIPLFFQPVKINGVEYVDGGYRNNIPIEYLGNVTNNPAKKPPPDPQVEEITNSPEKIKEAKKTGKVLAFAFGSKMDDPANIAVYSAKVKIYDPGSIVRFLMDVMYKMVAKVGGNFKYSDSENKTYNTLRENALGTVVLDTKDVTTLDFKGAQKKADYLNVKGYLLTMDYIKNHELGNNKDDNLEYKNFLLSNYEKIESPSRLESWKAKIFSVNEEKSIELLSFCKEEKWQNKTPAQILEDYVKLASTSGSGGKLSNDTKTINKLVETLNEPKTPNKIKEDFIKLLNIDLQQDVRMDKNKDMTANIVQLKFNKNDFSKFIDKHKNEMLKAGASQGAGKGHSK